MATNERENRDIGDYMMRLVRDDIAKQAGEQKFFVDKDVFSFCWETIKPWLHWTSLVNHMLRHHLTKDMLELSYMIKNGMRKEEDTITLFEMLDRNAVIGYHIMYICIKRDRQNPLGHDSAKEELEKRARETNTRPPPQVTNDNSNSASRIQQESIRSQEEFSGQHQMAQAQVLPTREQRPSEQQSAEVAMESQQGPQHPKFQKPSQCSDGPRPHHSFPAATLSSTNSSVAASDYDVSAHMVASDLANPGEMVFSAIYCSEAAGKDQAAVPVKQTPMDGQSACLPDAAAVGVACERTHPAQCSVTISKEDMFEAIQLMLKYKNINFVRSICDLQLISNKDCTSIEKLVDELVKFLVSCLNGRAQGLLCGVLLAGAEHQAESREITELGLALHSSTIPEKFFEIVDEKRMVQVQRDGDDQFEVAQSLSSIAHLQIMTDSKKENASRVLVMLVQPEVETCQDLLYVCIPTGSSVAVKEAYVRHKGRSERVKEPQLAQLRKQLAQHYARHHQ